MEIKSHLFEIMQFCFLHSILLFFILISKKKKKWKNTWFSHALSQLCPSENGGLKWSERTRRPVKIFYFILKAFQRRMNDVHVYSTLLAVSQNLKTWVIRVPVHGWIWIPLHCGQRHLLPVTTWQGPLPSQETSNISRELISLSLFFARSAPGLVLVSYSTA